MSTAAPAPTKFQPDTWYQRERERVLAELRCARMEHQLAVVHLDWLGLLVRDNEITVSGARAALADLYQGGHDAQE